MQNEPQAGPTPVAGLLRSARAVADLSQRDLAARCGVSKSALARMEQDTTGRTTTVQAWAAALRACGFTIEVTREGRRLAPDRDDARDRGGRLLPPHLDPHPVWRSLDWWGFRNGFGWDPRINGYTPARAYCLSRDWRALRRAREATPWDAGRWEDTRHLVSTAVPDAVAFRLAYGRTGPDSPRPVYLEGPEPEHGQREGFTRFYPWPRGPAPQPSGR